MPVDSGFDSDRLLLARASLKRDGWRHQHRWRLHRRTDSLEPLPIESPTTNGVLTGAEGWGTTAPTWSRPRARRHRKRRRRLHAGEIQTMPRDTEDSTASPAAATEWQLRALADESTATVIAVIDAGSTLLGGIMSLGREMSEFAAARMRDGIETSQRLMDCADPSEAFGVQCELARATREQFFSEAAKLMELAAETARRSWAPIEVRAQEALARSKGDD
jgi:hypothetical protein